jgi:hypothetical protein
MKRLATVLLMALFATTSVYALAADEGTTPPAKMKKHKAGKYKKGAKAPEAVAPATPAAPAAPAKQ